MIFGPKISKSNGGKYQAACRMASNIETEISQLLVIDRRHIQIYNTTRKFGI